MNKQTKPTAGGWFRALLLIVLGYEGAGALAGGAMLILAPLGNLMNMPVGIMHGAFPDFETPGVILFLMGVLLAVSFITVISRHKSGRIFAIVALWGMVVWFWVEIAVLRRLHWLHAMWGLPVVLGLIAAIFMEPPPRSVVRRLLLSCGILASVLYVIITIVTGVLWPAYDPLGQTVSELSAVGAPTRVLWAILSAPYTLMMIAFALGVRASAGPNGKLRLAGSLLFVYALLGLLWPFAPMHLRQVLASGGATWTDTMHIALAATTEAIYLVVLGLSAAALGNRFRWYSAATLAVLLAFGLLTFLGAPHLAAGEPTPLLGLWERINIAVFLAWIIALAIVLWKAPYGETTGTKTTPVVVGRLTL